MHKKEQDEEYWKAIKNKENADSKRCQLENRIKALETSVRTLEVVTGKLALANGIKVERYTGGLIVISQIEKI